MAEKKRSCGKIRAVSRRDDPCRPKSGSPDALEAGSAPAGRPESEMPVIRIFLQSSMKKGNPQIFFGKNGINPQIFGDRTASSQGGCTGPGASDGRQHGVRIHTDQGTVRRGLRHLQASGAIRLRRSRGAISQGLCEVQAVAVSTRRCEPRDTMRPVRPYRRDPGVWLHT